MIHQQFTELTKQPLSTRRHSEYIPLEVIQNVIGSLTSESTFFKWTQFGGRLMLAFFHPIPEKLPIIEFVETFKLPSYCGFNQWLIQHSDQTFNEDWTAPPTDIGVGVGALDLFIDLPDTISKSSITRYFSESGLRIDSYPPIVSGSLLLNLSFIIRDAESHRFSFSLSQKVTAQIPEEEEEDPIDTTVKVHGSLFPGIDFFFDNENESITFTVRRWNAKVVFDIKPSHVVLYGTSNETHRIITRTGKLIRYTPTPIIYYPNGAIETFIKGVWHLVDEKGHSYVKRDNVWFIQPEFNATEEKISTFFTTREVIKRSNGVSFIIENDKQKIVFPDRTEFDKVTQTYSHPDLLSVSIVNKKFQVQAKEFKAEFVENDVCSLIMTDASCSIQFTPEISSLVLQYGNFSPELTMLDLVTGLVATAGARRCVYYLGDDWNWKIGRQLCSKKEIVQQFQQGAFLEHIQSLTEMDAEEIKSIMKIGHQPRLFIVEKEFGEFKMIELLDDVMRKKILNCATKGCLEECPWFETEPISFRELKTHSKLSTEKIDLIAQVHKDECRIEEQKNELRLSVVDPKWKVFEFQQSKEEEEMIELYRKFKVQDLVQKLIAVPVSKIDEASE
jgi:hypothetical protein